MELFQCLFTTLCMNLGNSYSLKLQINNLIILDFYMKAVITHFGLIFLREINISIS